MKGNISGREMSKRDMLLSGVATVLSMSLTLMVNSCQSIDARRFSVPSKLVKGRNIYIGQTLSEAADKHHLSRSEVDDSYFEEINSPYFDRINYQVRGGDVEEITLLAESETRSTTRNLAEIFAICRSTFGDSLRVKDNYGKGVHERIWIWKLSSEKFAWLYCSDIQALHGATARLRMIMFYMGEVGEWEGLRAWVPSMGATLE